MWGLEWVHTELSDLTDSTGESSLFGDFLGNCLLVLEMGFGGVALLFSPRISYHFCVHQIWEELKGLKERAIEHVHKVIF